MFLISVNTFTRHAIRKWILITYIINLCNFYRLDITFEHELNYFLLEHTSPLHRLVSLHSHDGYLPSLSLVFLLSVQHLASLYVQYSNCGLRSINIRKTCTAAYFTYRIVQIQNDMLPTGRYIICIIVLNLENLLITCAIINYRTESIIGRSKNNLLFTIHGKLVRNSRPILSVLCNHRIHCRLCLAELVEKMKWSGPCLVKVWLTGPSSMMGG